jgi:CheY-like chemotaxis protein
LQKQLIGSGYRVSVANHGQEAFDKVLASQASPTTEIDVILMDVEMPILDVPSTTPISLMIGTSSDSTFA